MMSAGILTGLGIATALLAGGGEKGSFRKSIPYPEEDYNKTVDNLIAFQIPMLKRFLTGRASFFQLAQTVVQSPVVIENSILAPIQNKVPPCFIIIAYANPEWSWVNEKAMRNSLWLIGLFGEIFKNDFSSLIGTDYDFVINVRRQRKGNRSIRTFPKNFYKQALKWIERLRSNPVIKSSPRAPMINHVFNITGRDQTNFGATVASYNTASNTICVYAKKLYSSRTRWWLNRDLKADIYHEVRHYIEHMIEEFYKLNKSGAIRTLKRIQNLKNKYMPQMQSKTRKQLHISKEDWFYSSIFFDIVNLPVTMLSGLHDRTVGPLKESKNADTDRAIVLAFLEGNSPLQGKFPIRDRWMPRYYDILHELGMKPVAPPPLNLSNEEIQKVKKVILNAYEVYGARIFLTDLMVDASEKSINVYRHMTPYDMPYEELPVEELTLLGDVEFDFIDTWWDYKTNNFTTDPKKIDRFYKTLCFIENKFKGKREHILGSWGVSISLRFRSFVGEEDKFLDKDRYDLLLSQYLVQIQRSLNRLIDHYGKIDCVKFMEDGTIDRSKFERKKKFVKGKNHD